MLNRRKKNTLAGILLLVASSCMAQSYVDDALTFSQTRPGGSARIQAIGGAQVALGGDYSSTLSNPAGLGIYNRSEFTFSSALSGYTAKSSYLSNSDKEGKLIFNIPGISVVFHSGKDKDGFLGGSFGLSMSRINDFQGVTTVHGRNNDTSIIDSYIGIANGADTRQFDEFDGDLYNTPTGLAFNNYLIGDSSILIPPGSDEQYFTDVQSVPDQRMILETKGAANQWSISYGGNFTDIIFFGGGIGITSLKYNSQRTFDESFANDPNFNYLSVTENLKTKGTGINLTVGLIVRPIDFFQIGASFTTPTLYSITSTYDASMNSSWKSYDYYGDGSKILDDIKTATDVVVSEYSLTTPLKFNAGIALISKFGFITGDIELINPAQSRYSFDENKGLDYYIDFTQDNSVIKSVYKTAVNYRIGAEFRHDIYRVRGGLGVQGNGYQKDLGLDNSTLNISGGLGMRTKTYFVDLALINSSQKKYSYQPYFLGDGSGPVAEIKKNTFTGMITVGFIF